MRELGELVGLPLAEARRRLEGAGLVVQVTVTAAPDEPARRRARQVGPRATLWRVVRAEWARAGAGDPDAGSPGPDGRAGSGRRHGGAPSRIAGAVGAGRPATMGGEGAGAAAVGGGGAVPRGGETDDGAPAEGTDGGNAEGPRTVRLVVAAFPLPPLPRADLEGALGEAARASWGPPTAGEGGGSEGP